MASQLLGLQLLSTKFEKKMRAEGFDFFRRICTISSTTYGRLTRVCHIGGSSSSQDVRLYGSVGEGIFYPMISCSERDVDFVGILKNIVAVENVHDANQDYAGMGSGIHLIENDQTLPGYCYLRNISVDAWLALMNLFWPMTSEIKGYQYLSGSAIKGLQRLFMGITDTPTHMLSMLDDCLGKMHAQPIGQHGPATNVHFPFNSHPAIDVNISKIDFVFVIPCPKWPSCASEWITRRRQYDWPTERLITKIVAKGIYFAPVGCKGHPLGDLQWRYSFNEAEQQLVRSFNSIQAKCYALLKRIISENVTPQFQEDVISSYHIKTLMLWTIEETDPRVWVAANLIQCVFLVLERLVLCVECGKCPSYFMPDENLFLNKVTEINKENMKTVIATIIVEGWPVLTRLSNFAIDYYFIRNIHEEYDTQEYDPEEFICNTLNSPLNIIEACENSFLPSFLAHESDRIYSSFNDLLNHLILEANSCDDPSEKDSLKRIIAHVCSSYGTHCLSLARRQNMESLESQEIENFGEIYIELSCLGRQVECLAKQANYAYVRGNLQYTLAIANKIIRMHPTDSWICNPYIPSDVQNKSLLSCMLKAAAETGDISGAATSEIKGLSLHRNVLFMKNEIYALPGNVKVEMFMVGKRLDPCNFLSSIRRCFGVNPYLYGKYLSFLVYSDMRLQEEADKAITMMEFECRSLPNSYLPASLNLLGDCYLRRGKVDKAIATFALSMQRNSITNAAPWHVARLVWRKLLERWLTTRNEDNLVMRI